MRTTISRPRTLRDLRLATVLPGLALLVVTTFAQDAPPAPTPPVPPPIAERSPTGNRQAPVPGAAEAADRRARAADAAGTGAVLLVLSPTRVDGVPGTNRNPDFEYLSPLGAPEGALLVAAPGRATAEPQAPSAGGADAPPVPAPPAAQAGSDAGSPAIDRLYLPIRSPAMERWTGPEPGPGPETAAAAGFREARAIGQLADDVVAALGDRSTLLVSAGPAAAGGPMLARLLAEVRERLPGRWVRIVDAPGGGRDDLVESLRRALPANVGERTPEDVLAKLPVVDVRSAKSVLAELREVKSAAEIDRVRRATAATVEGHLDAMRAARAGLFEYHLAAILELRCRAGGCARQAYPSIAGSGPNSCILHYDRNTRRLADGDLVVFDAGGEFEGYACDVTRTFPVSGRFTDEQAKVYDAVLEAQTAAIAAVRPGVTLRQVHEVARSVLEKHGLAKWFIHGTCHAVGLEVHDAWRRDAVLRAGCVITVEPGVYDAARNLGVRIEDTVLVTGTGCEVLSSALPKSRAEIEALMREDPPPGLPR